MKILKVGDTKKAICTQCQSLQKVTFQLRDIPFSDNSGVVKNVLVGICDHCDSIAILPHQSTPAVKRQLAVQRKSLESRIPAHMIDILNLASDTLGGGTDFSPSIMKFYIHSLANNDISAKDISNYLETDLAKGKAQKRISIKGCYLSEELSHLKEITQIKTTASLIKSIILKINDDLLVHKREYPITQLKNLLAVTC